MYPSTALFGTTVDGPHTVIAQVDVWKQGGKTLLYSSKMSSIKANTLDGSVTINRSSGPRRQFSLSMVLQDYSLYTKYFDPRLNYDIRLHRGIRYSDGSEELIPLGVFRAETATLTSSADGLRLDLSGQDMSLPFSQRKFYTSFNIDPITYSSPFDAIQNLVATYGPVSEYQSVDILVSPTSYALPIMAFTDRDNPWASLQKIAEALEAEAYYDAKGLLYVKKIVDPSTMSPVLDVTSSVLNMRTGKLVRSINTSNTYNGVIVRGSAPWLLLPVEGSAYDEEGFSPTFRYGPFGERPELIEDAVVTSSVQAAAVALARLNKIRGASEQVTFEMIPDPRLDVSDVVTINDSYLGLYDKLSIDTLTIPLMHGKMTGTLKLAVRGKL